MIVDSPADGAYNPQFRQSRVEVSAVAYAIIRSGDKQFRVTTGSVVRVPRIEAEVGAKANFDVLVFGDGNDVKVGAPLVGGVGVEGTVLEHGRGEKIIVFKMKRRKGYRKTQGHRQGYTAVRIDTVG
jgi:large subunit ribosomal protein L21